MGAERIALTLTLTLTSTSTSTFGARAETWLDVASRAAVECASTSTPSTCVNEGINNKARKRGKFDAAYASCALREVERAWAKANATLRAFACDDAARDLGMNAYDSDDRGVGTSKCGREANVACDGSCARGVFAAFLANDVERNGANASASAIVARWFNAIGSDSEDVGMFRAKAAGFGIGQMTDAIAGWRACDVATASAERVASCRAGWGFGYVENANANATNAGKRFSADCSTSAFALAANEEAEAMADACAEAAGAEAYVEFASSERAKTERCDEMASDRAKRKCAGSAREEEMRRDILKTATLSECDVAMRVQVGQDAPPTPSPSPPPPIGRKDAEEKIEAMRRHGAAIGGVLWWTCFVAMLTLTLGTTTYLRCRGERSSTTVHYTHLNAELAEL